MLTTTSKKRGRPAGRYRMRNGLEIQGLTRRADGRWKISSSGQTFVEPDEGLAVARFQQIEAQRQPGIASLGRSVMDDEDGLELLKKYASLPGPSVTIPNDRHEPVRFDFPVFQYDLWRYVRKQIIDRRKWVAEQIGIEQIGYLEDIEEPKPSLALDKLIDLYAAKAGITAEEISRCRKFWNEFATITRIETIRELAHEHVEKYELAIAELNLAPKSVKHRYTRIRTVLAHALKRGKGQEDCRRALDKLMMLEVDHVNTLDPKPISPVAFWKIHAAAKNAKDPVFTAMLLFALNCAMYPSEVGSVRWDDVDMKRGEFSARRNKTQVPRVACLWGETIAALKKLPHDRQTIFNTPFQPYNRCSVHRDWTIYREAAGIKAGTTFGMIRDAAFTIGCRVSADQARLLSGHRRAGAVDHYVLRDPAAVKDACNAIHAEFFGRSGSKK